MSRLRTSHVLVAIPFLVVASLGAQTPPAVHELLKTGSDWVGGVAEPASGRFVVYADEHSLKIYNRQTHQTTSVPVKIRGRVANALSISRSGGRVVFPAADDAKGMEYAWVLDLDTLTGRPTSE